MGRATLVRQHCAECASVKPRIDARIAGAKNHVTDTGSVSFGFAAPNCVDKETNCINMLRVCCLTQQNNQALHMAQSPVQVRKHFFCVFMYILYSMWLFAGVSSHDKSFFF